MLFLLLLGLGVGLVSSLLGIGGGIFLVPLLPALTGWTPHQVVALTLLIILGNSFVNLWWFSKYDGLVNWPILKLWGPAAAIGSFAGSFAAIQASSAELQYALLAIIFLMMIKFSMDYFAKWEDKKLFVSSDWHPLKSVYGLLVGSLSGFSGVGTGLVSNIIFMSRRWVDKDQVSPTGNGVMFCVSLSSVVAFLTYGQGQEVDLSFMLSSWKEVSLIMVSVFVTSFFVRPFNSFMTDNLRFLCLMTSLMFVFGYVVLQLI